MKKLIPILLLTFISQMSYANGTPEGDNSGGDDKVKKYVKSLINKIHLL